MDVDKRSLPRHSPYPTVIPAIFWAGGELEVCAYLRNSDPGRCRAAGSPTTALGDDKRSRKIAGEHYGGKSLDTFIENEKKSYE